MNNVLLLTAAIDALVKGAQLFVVIDNLSAVRQRMAQEGRADVSDADLDLVRGSIQARQNRIDQS